VKYRVTDRIREHALQGQTEPVRHGTKHADSSGIAEPVLHVHVQHKRWRFKIR
jgi:hypothetical protein